MHPKIKKMIIDGDIRAFIAIPNYPEGTVSAFLLVESEKIRCCKENEIPFGEPIQIVSYGKTITVDDITFEVGYYSCAKMYPEIDSLHNLGIEDTWTNGVCFFTHPLSKRNFIDPAVCVKDFILAQYPDANLNLPVFVYYVNKLK